VTVDERPVTGKSRVRLSEKFRRALTDIFYQVTAMTSRSRGE
jgi:hypothetical protein